MSLRSIVLLLFIALMILLVVTDYAKYLFITAPALMVYLILDEKFLKKSE